MHWTRDNKICWSEWLIWATNTQMSLAFSTLIRCVSFSVICYRLWWVELLSITCSMSSPKGRHNDVQLNNISQTSKKYFFFCVEHPKQYNNHEVKTYKSNIAFSYAFTFHSTFLFNCQTLISHTSKRLFVVSQKKEKKSYSNEIYITLNRMFAFVNCSFGNRKLKRQMWIAE